MPFVIRGVRGGFVDLEGIARLEGATLVLEFQTMSVFARFIRSKPRELRVPLADLEEAVFKRGWLLGFLHLRARTMGAFGAVPGSAGSELRLRCRRAHWPAAQDLAAKLSMSLATQELRAMVASSNLLDDPKRSAQ